MASYFPRTPIRPIRMLEIIIFTSGSPCLSPYAFRKYDRLHDRNFIVLEVERSKA